MCGKMPEEDHSVRPMDHRKKRSGKEMLRDALHLFLDDLKNLWVALLVIAIYLELVMRFCYSSCPMLMITGFPCPGCGLTRAGIALLKLHFIRAFSIHPMIYPIAVFILVFLFRRYVLLKSNQGMVRFAVMILVGLVLVYVYRMIRYFPDKEPMIYYSGSVLGKWFSAWKSIAFLG